MHSIHASETPPIHARMLGLGCPDRRLRLLRIGQLVPGFLDLYLRPVQPFNRNTPVRLFAVAIRLKTPCTSHSPPPATPSPRPSVLAALYMPRQRYRRPENRKYLFVSRFTLIHSEGTVSWRGRASLGVVGSLYRL